MTKAQQLGITKFPYIEFDSFGNRTYYETSIGFWAKIDHDSNGNRIYSENSDGYWFKYDYDSLENNIYLERYDEFGYFRYYEGKTLIKEIKEDYKIHYINYKRNLILNTLLNDY